MTDGAVAAQAGARAAAVRSFLAFDFGTRRIGVATGNTVLRQAQPLRSVPGDAARCWPAIAALVAEWQPDALVVGVPRHPDGTPHDMTLHAQRFARRLHGRHRLPVHEVDERYTSVEAQSMGARDLDAGAAALILEQYLRSLP